MKPPATPGAARTTADDPQPVQLGFAQAMTSPCLSCSSSPCCTNLPLSVFRVTTLAELDRARYLLNFDRIELGLAASGDWTVYYRYPCRFLDRDTFGCTIHDAPEQPLVCSQYNPFNCWYQRALTEQIPDEFVRVDRRRLEWLVERIVFDEDRNIVGVPAWPVMVDAFAGLEVVAQGTFHDDPVENPVFDEWIRVAVELGRRYPESAAPFDAPEPPDDPDQPCDGCAAACCETVVFPLVTPTSSTRLDHIRFCLGFPGIEVGVDGDGEWTIAVQSTCRHLDAGRCSVYGTPERPLRCQYFDEHQCIYRRDFIPVRPESRVRIRFEEFGALAGLFAFDVDGEALAVPAADEVRAAIESEWPARARS